MRATANGRTFEDVSWNGLVSRVVAALGTEKSTAGERVYAADQLYKGVSTVVAGVLIKPEGARE